MLPKMYSRKSELLKLAYTLLMQDTTTAANPRVLLKAVENKGTGRARSYRVQFGVLTKYTLT